jgi:class 3 adenylate cyclase
MPIDDQDLGISERRLWRLIEERTRPDADTAAIDRRIFDLFGERWAIMFTDLSGFSRRVEEFGIMHFLQIIYEQRKLLLPIVEAHDGLLLKSEADSFLLLFRRPERALACAIAMQRACEQINRRRKPEEQILLCVGIGHGDVLRIGDTDVWGREVNAASKLGEDTARAGEILVSSDARDALVDFPAVGFKARDEAVAGTKQSFEVDYTGAA